MNWLRKNMKTIIWITVFAFVTTIFASWGMGYLSMQNRNRNLAEINGESVSVEQYQEIVDRLRQKRQENKTGPLSQKNRDQLNQEAFKQLVNQVLLQQAAVRKGAAATDREIRRLVASQPMFRDKEGRFQKKRFQRFLNEITAKQREKIEKRQRTRLESSRFRKLLRGQISITDTEARHALRRGLREIQLFGIFLDPSEYIKEQRIQNYYENNDRQFRAPPRAHLYQLKLSGLPDTSPDHKQRLEEIKRQIKLIRRKFKGGTEFTQLARNFSTDTSTARNGGARGWVTPEELRDEIARRTFNLEPNQLSNLVSVDNDYYLLYIDKPIKREKKDLEVVKPEIEKVLLGDTHWQQAKQRAESLSEQIQAAAQPVEQLRQFAPESHGKAANLRGSYGWVPVKFIADYVPDERRQKWMGELTEANQSGASKFILPAISSNLLEHSSTGGRWTSEPIKTNFGYHLLGGRGVRPGNPGQLTEEEHRLFVNYLRREKHSQFLTSWLKWKRKQAEVELQVSKSRIGGKLPEEFK